jgi:hypothetical protein
LPKLFLSKSFPCEVKQGCTVGVCLKGSNDAALLLWQQRKENEKEREREREREREQTAKRASESKRRRRKEASQTKRRRQQEGHSFRDAI